MLLSFALAAGAVLAIQRRRWWLLDLLTVPAPLAVDCYWPGELLNLTAWHWFIRRWDLAQGGISINGLYFETLADWRDVPYFVYMAMYLLCALNGNGRALLATPLMLLGEVNWKLPSTRWAFYGY